MDMEQALVGRMLADPSFAAASGGRLYPSVAPQDAARPYAVYSAVSRLAVRTMTGVEPLNSYRMQLDCYGDSYGDAQALGKAAVAMWDGFAGRVGGGVLKVQGAFVDDDADGYDEPVHADDVGVFSRRVELAIYFNAP